MQRSFNASLYFSVWTLQSSSCGTLVRAVIDCVNDVMRVLAVHGAANRLGSAEDLLADSTELPGHGPGPHGARSLVDVVHGDVPVVLDILHLLPVPGRLLQGLDDEGRGRGNNRDGGLSVLNLQLHGHLQALPGGGVLGNVVTDLLGRETQGTDLGGEGGGGSDLSADSSQVNVLHLIGIKLGRHLGLLGLLCTGKCSISGRACLVVDEGSNTCPTTTELHLTRPSQSNVGCRERVSGPA